MKHIFLLLILLLTSVSSAHAFVDSYTIDRDKLPAEAQEILAEHFPKAKIGMIKVDRHLLKKPDYEVRLVNGSTIEFNNKGKWRKVDCKNREVPSSLIPKSITRSVTKNFPDVKITSIVKEVVGLRNRPQRRRRPPLRPPRHLQRRESHRRSRLISTYAD